MEKLESRQSTSTRRKAQQAILPLVNNAKIAEKTELKTESSRIVETYILPFRVFAEVDLQGTLRACPGIRIQPDLPIRTFKMTANPNCHCLFEMYGQETA